MVSDYDGAWKDLLHRRLPEILACYFPAISAAIDWSHAPVFLDQELRELHIVVPETVNRVDFLVSVTTFDGSRQMLFLHLEVQSFQEEDFTNRIFRYFHGIRHSCGENIISMVILADLDPDWIPSEYHYERLGCEVSFRFPCCKLLEILPRIEQDFSLPALAAKAQISALQTSRDPEKRSHSRWILTRSLYEHGYTKEEINEAYRLIAWMMRLPKPQALIFREQLVEFEKEKDMPYLTDTEEIALNHGRQEGRQEGQQRGQLIAQQEAVIEALEIRFDRVPEGLREEIARIADSARLHALLRAAIRCADLESFSKEL